jgi:hypothetical protein
MSGRRVAGQQALRQARCGASPAPEADRPADGKMCELSKSMAELSIAAHE